MKKKLAILLSMLLVLSVLTACNGNSSGGNNPPVGGGDKTPAVGGEGPGTGEKNPVIKLGVFEPQSGDNGAGGKQEILGIEYAHYLQPTVEIAGVTYDIQLVYSDNQSDTAVAPSAAQYLVSAGCSIVVGSYGSGVCIASSDVFGDAGIPVIGVSCTNPAVTEGNSHFFRICFLDPFQGTVLSNFAKDQWGATKAYVLAKDGDDYSVGLATYFIKAFGEENCFFEKFPGGTTDYSTYVANARTFGAEVFFSPTSNEAASLIIDAITAQGFNVPVLAGDTWDSNVILNAAKGKNIELFITTFYQEGAAPEFDAGIKAWINADPNRRANNGGDDKLAAFTVMGFDGYNLALEAMRKAGSGDPAVVLPVVGSVTWEGITGAIAFDEIGDAIRDTAFVKRCNPVTGDWEFVAQQGVS